MRIKLNFLVMKERSNTTHFGYEPKASGKEAPNLEPSLTQPDQNMSIRQIVERYTRTRIPPELKYSGGYTEDADFDSPDLSKFRDLDLVDRAEARDEARADRLRKEAHVRAQAKQRRESRTMKPAKEAPPSATKAKPANDARTTKEDDANAGEDKE